MVSETLNILVEYVNCSLDMDMCKKKFTFTYQSDFVSVQVKLKLCDFST